MTSSPTTNQKRNVQGLFFKGWRPITVTPPCSVFDWKLWAVVTALGFGFGVIVGLWIGG
jgi:hypothetical protein